MKLVITKKGINYLLTLAIVIWYTVPIVQARGGMLPVAALLVLWFLTSDINKAFRCMSSILPCLVMLLVLSIWLLYGTKFYGGIDTVYFAVSVLLMFIPGILFWYHVDDLTPLKRNILIFVFFAGLLYGAINTYIVLEEYPIASRLMATSEGDIYSEMGAGGFGFAYSVMLAFPFLIEVFKSNKNKILKLLYLFMIVFFIMTIIKCEYTTCLLLLIFGVAIYFLYRSNKLIGMILLVVAVMFFSMGEQLGEMILDLADLLSDTEVISVRLKDLANAILNEDMNTLESSRYDLYMTSVDGFLSNPFVGTGFADDIITGGHSTILDTLSLYGIFGLIAVVLPFAKGIKKTRNTISNNATYKTVTLTFWVLTILNPTVYIYQLGVIIFFMVPIGLNIKNDEPSIQTAD